ncbi:uncharacterized protein LOC110831110 [Zootermopsis nevadensis]|uniref:Cuticle protein 6 n=1 Tax=Zootermopsis nevadensis TaxID=136037 RepID=A0A067RDR5_ZOONE|nr:uncharacterized protein LOC110831110 [Zootermopsis nevadensis]KDR18149.1 hypothetical protein L798_08009 [Zootermopsis nevadensis]
MRQHLQTLPVLVGIMVLLFAPPGFARRVRVRPVNEDVEDQEVRDQQVQYYAAQAPADDSQTAGVVLVSSQDAYNGLQYARPRTQAAVREQEYRPIGRTLSATSPVSRPKESSKQPPVQTIRNYSKYNDDGSFTFGYEAADGSFKEEVRGTDCVVRGKYGYVDPDGNKREFTYVSGNPCDPNSVSQEEESGKELADDSGEENIPKGPIRPLRPRPTAAPLTRTTTTIFQENYNQADEDQLEYEPQQVYQPAPPVRSRVVPQPVRRPQVYQYAQNQEDAVTQPPAVRITPRPLTLSTTVKSQLPATTYRPQLIPVSATPRPGVVYTKEFTSVGSPTQSSIYSTPTTVAPVDFDAELRKFQLENNVVSTPRTVARPAVSSSQPLYQQPRPTARPQLATIQQTSSKQLSSNPVYQTELVYDPSSGQYNTVLYQTLPQTTAEVSLKHRLQPYVNTEQSQSLFTPQIYNQIQQNQQLYSQQQQQRVVEQRYQPTSTKITGPQRFQLYQPQQTTQRSVQPFYYVAPSDVGGQAQGQIDAFLRGHNIAF